MLGAASPKAPRLGNTASSKDTIKVPVAGGGGAGGGATPPPTVLVRSAASAVIETPGAAASAPLFCSAKSAMRVSLCAVVVVLTSCALVACRMRSVCTLSAPAITSARLAGFTPARPARIPALSSVEAATRVAAALTSEVRAAVSTALPDNRAGLARNCAATAAATSE